MLLAVALNPVLDNDIAVVSLLPGKDINPIKSSLRAGGKALNVARIWSVLGDDSHVVGFIAGATGALIEHAIIDSGISHHLVEASGSSRICTNITEGDGRQTSIHQYGSFAVSESARGSLVETFHELVRSAACCVVSGSLPPSMPHDFYSNLVRMCREAKVPCILDTAGLTLKSTIAALPTVVKINQIEAAHFLQGSVDNHVDAYAACRALTAAGAETAIVTLSEAGAVAYESHTSKAWHIIPPRLRATSSVGCGDAFVAGLSRAMAHGVGSIDRYAFAAAVAAAVALDELPDHLDRGVVGHLAESVRVEEIG